jgi:hypothetical protein
MQVYKSNKNIELEQKIARRLEKQRGEVPFEVDINYSAHITVTFPKEYANLPIILFTPVITDGSEFDVSVALVGRTKKDFTVNIQNIGDIVAKGYLMWLSE